MILEETSENLSNLGQGPSPLKHPMQRHSNVNAMVTNFAQVFKTMTPLPKLNQAFSALPSSRGTKMDLANDQSQNGQ